MRQSDRDVGPRLYPQWLPTALLPIILVATAWTALVTVQTIRSQKLDAVLLDLVGRQRTLNQRHMKELLLASRGLPADPAWTSGLFMDTALVLADGGTVVANIETGETIDLPPSTAPSVRRALERQRELMALQIAAADAWMAMSQADPGRAAGMDELLKLNDALHRETHATVKAVEGHEAARVSSALKWSLVSAGVMLLMYVGLFWLNRGLLAVSRRHRDAVEHLDTVMASVVDGLITIDGRGTILSFSPSAEGIFGYSAAEAIGQNVKLLMPEPYRSEHDGYLAGYHRSGQAKIIGVGREVLGRRKDATTFPVDLSVSEVKTADTHLFVGLVRDITDRKRVEQELRRSHERFDLAVAGSSDGLWDWNVQTGEVYYSPRFKKLLGYEEHEIANEFESFRSRLHLDDLDETLAAIQAHLDTRVAYDVEYRLRNKSGEFCWFRARGQALWDDDGKPTRMSGTITDVSEQKRVERLLEQEALRAKLLHQATTMAAETDSFDEMLRQCVRIVCEIAGWPIGHVYLPCTLRPDRLRPSAIWHLPADGRADDFREITERTTFVHGEGLPGRIWATGEPAWIVDVNRDDNFPRSRSGGDLRVKGAFGFPVKIGGEPVAILEFFSEREMRPDPNLLMIAGSVGEQVGRVLERKRAEAALREATEAAERANRTKSQFLATMSHELRTPLNSVIGFSNILLKNKAGNLRRSDINYLERICSNGRHLLSLINDVLDLSKIEAGRMDIALEPIELPTVIDNVIQQLLGQAAAEHVGLTMSVPSAMAKLPADPQRMSQVLINLVGNALKFTPSGGTVSVRAVADDDHRPLRIDVVDSGCGIAADKLETIFDSFQQADGSTSRKYGGTGLGLSISRSLSRLMGFDLAVASVVDQGSTFSVMLAAGAPAPVHEAPGAVADPNGDAAPLSEVLDGNASGVRTFSVEPTVSGKVVLVIDDDADSRVVLEKYLEDYGCRVVAVDSAARGVEVARALRPDIITLDLMMPEVNGWSALRTLKEDPLTGDIPVVIVSIVASENRARLVGAVNFIDKPMEREQLYDILERTLGTQSCQVLIVEDDADTREILVELVRESGATARTASNGEDALTELKSFTPDLILLDMMMPVMDGCSFLTQLRRDPNHQQLPVVIVTAKELSSDERLLLEASTESIVAKGGMLAEGVRHALHRLLAGAAS